MSQQDDQVRELFNSEDLSLAGSPLGNQLETKPSKPDAEVAKLFDQEKASNVSQLQDSLYFGVQKNPDSYAEAIDLAKKAGIPVPVVEENKDEIKQKYLIKEIDPQTFHEVNPVTAKFLRNPFNAGLASDDVKALAEMEGKFADFSKGYWETSLNNIIRGTSGMFTSSTKGVASAESIGAKNMLQEFDLIDQEGPVAKNDMYFPNLMDPTFLQYRNASPEERKALRDQVAAQLDPRESKAYKIADMVQKSTSEAYRINPVYGSEFGAGTLSSGAGSMFGFMIGQSIFRNPAAIGAMGALTEGQSAFEDALKHGSNLETALSAYGANAPVGVSEMIPIARMFDRVDKLTGGGIKQAILELFKAGFEEGSQEFGQQIWNNLVAAKLVKYDPDRGIVVGAGENAAAGFTLGALTQFIIGMVGGKGRIPPDIKQTLEQTMVQEFHDAAKNAKLLQRAPDAFRDYLNQLQDQYGPDESVYVPAKHLKELVDQGLITGDTKAGREILDQYQDATKEGGDVVIPVADYITDIAANEELANQFQDIVRLSPETLSNREAKEIDAENPQALLQMVEQAGKDADLKAEVDTVVNGMVDQLVSTGVVDKRQAQINAKVFSAYVATKAANIGMTPSEVFKAMNLDIQGIRDTVLPQQIFEPGQNLGDLQLTRDVVVKETGERGQVKRKAQDVWDELQEKRDRMSSLLECLRG